MLNEPCGAVLCGLGPAPHYVRRHHAKIRYWRAEVVRAPGGSGRRRRGRETGQEHEQECGIAGVGTRHVGRRSGPDYGSISFTCPSLLLSFKEVVAPRACTPAAPGRAREMASEATL